MIDPNVYRPRMTNVSLPSRHLVKCSLTQCHVVIGKNNSVIGRRDNLLYCSHDHMVQADGLQPEGIEIEEEFQQ